MANKTKKIPFAKIKGLRAERQMSMADMAKILGMSEGS
jgi:DNA-binding XRE family transcriptional regulator